MSRFTDLFEQPQPVAEPAPAPEPVKEVVEDKVVPITKASKKKKFTLD
jgi:hypothetical protein